MTTSLLIALILTLLIILLTASLFYLNWQQKREHHRQFERLLDDFDGRQADRNNLLIQHLTDAYGMKRNAAEVLANQLISAEKLFLQQFIKQQLQHKSVEGFYQQLCELLDAYLDKLPTAGQPASPFHSANDANKTASVDDTPPPEWGDVFD